MSQDTEKHIKMVQLLMSWFISQLDIRAASHDQSKLKEPEVSIFDKFSPRLKSVSYGDFNYVRFLIEMKPALDHHYLYNRHHPEHFENGVEDMNLIDIIEMFIDWKASTLRNLNGDIFKSIKINSKRFKMNKQLESIFYNTAKVLMEFKV